MKAVLPVSGSITFPPPGNGLTAPFTHGHETGDVGPTQAPTAADDATSVPASCLWAHGGMVSTLSDMRIWAKALATGALLTPEVWKEAPPTWFPSSSGGTITDQEGRATDSAVESGGFIGAEGSFAGYESATTYSPSLQTAIEVESTTLANAVTPPPMIQALAMGVFGSDSTSASRQSNSSSDWSKNRHESRSLSVRTSPTEL